MIFCLLNVNIWLSPFKTRYLSANVRFFISSSKYIWSPPVKNTERLGNFNENLLI